VYIDVVHSLVKLEASRMVHETSFKTATTDMLYLSFKHLLYYFAQSLR